MVPHDGALLRCKEHQHIYIHEAHNIERDRQFKQQIKQSLPSLLRHQPSRATNMPNIKANSKQGNAKQQSASKLTSK
eukprot:11174416-Ditylum_brightwellii.AAC.1